MFAGAMARFTSKVVRSRDIVEDGCMCTSLLDERSKLDLFFGPIREGI